MMMIPSTMTLANNSTAKRALLLSVVVAAAAAAATTDHNFSPPGDDDNENHHQQRRGGGLRTKKKMKNGRHHGRPPLLSFRQQQQRTTSFESRDESHSTFPRHPPPPHDSRRSRRRLPQATDLTATDDGEDDAHTGETAAAFNPNLVAYDPNSSEYQVDHHPTSSSGSEIPPPGNWSPCPANDLNFSGHRASYDCTSYIECSGGQPRGEYMSCMGLKFDNDRGVCDWAENVICATAEDGDGSSPPAASTITTNEGNGTQGNATNNNNGQEEEIIGSITDYDIDRTNSAGSNGAEANTEVTGWSGGSDWGGSWIDGVWVPTGDSTKADDNSDEAGSTSNQWDSAQIVPFPKHPILPFQKTTSLSNDTLPQAYNSSEGWSLLTRSNRNKTVIGYYAIWQLYDSNERAKPTNMQFSKVDRVNYAFFQTDAMGNIWGTDSWADPITLFGPLDWSIVVPDHAGYAPQFNDNNGFVDSQDEWTYTGSKYIDLGFNVLCHRATPTGKRDCMGHVAGDGIIGRAHSQGASVYVSIGGWSLSDVFPELSANAESRRTFAMNCVGLIREYNFDGIDIEWEFPGYGPHNGTSADGDNFVLLLQDIRSAIDAYTIATYPNGERTIGLTAALPCNPSIIDHQDIPRVSAALDELNLMTYDFHGTWNDKVGINSPLFDQPRDKFDSPEHSVNGCVKRWVRDGADKSKINIGLPFYGRSYSGTTELYSTFDGADALNWWADEGQPQYYNILDKLINMTSLRDNATETQFAFFEDGSGVISFDNSQSICDKVEYALEEELHGYIIWELSGDLTEDLRTPLLDAVNFKLEQGDTFDCESFRLETRDENGEVVKQEIGKPDPWYAYWETGTCVNDGKQPKWEKKENLFRYKEECCSYKFEYKFDTCMGPPTYEPTKSPENEPSLSPIITDETTDSPTHIFGAAQVVGSSPSPVAREAEGVDGVPVTKCLGGCQGANEKCVGNENNPQSVSDEDCAVCDGGQTFWPCDVEGLCFCWDPATPRIPPAPASGLAQTSDERPCDFFTESIFNSLAPEAQDPYTYEGLCAAIDAYNKGHAEKIFMMGTEEERKSELAAFLGNTLHESDEWKASREYLICGDHKVVGTETYCKPCDSESFDWETFTCGSSGLVGEGLTYNGYCDHTIKPPAACTCDDALTSESGDLEGYIPANKVFFGRGAIQLSWNYNYRAASEALTGDAATFCDNPDLVATNPEYAWGAGIFYWMENLKEETTCHIEALRNHDFGGLLNNINGGLECPAAEGGWHHDAVKLRLNRYCKSSSALGLESILIFDGCKLLNNSYAECLGDGTCPDCVQYGSDSFVAPPVSTATGPTEIAVSTSQPTEDGVEETTEPIMSSAPTATTGALPTLSPTVALTLDSSSVPDDPNEVLATGNVDEANQTSVSCPQNLFPVDGLPGCCVPEPSFHGDGACDPEAPLNTPECEYDGGDCCRETCDLESTYGCSVESSEYGPFGFFCLNPDLEEFIDPELCTVSDRTRIGDGRCDAGEEMYNSEACHWDAGDCCPETCDKILGHFECGDPAHPYDCQDPNSIRSATDTSNPTLAPSRSESSPSGSSQAGSFAQQSPASSVLELEPTTSTATTEDSKISYINLAPTADNSSHSSLKTTTTSTEAGGESTTSTDVTTTTTDAITTATTTTATTTTTRATTIATTTRATTIATTTRATTTTTTTSTTPSHYTLTPSDDATIVANHPDDNYGSDTTLQVDNDSGVYDALLRFDLSDIVDDYETVSDVVSATLRLFCTDGSEAGGILGKTTHSDWNETSVTWSNAPAAYGAPIHNLGLVKAATWYEIDLTSLFSDGYSMDAVSLRLTSKSWNRASYSSKEGSQPPQLVIKMQGGSGGSGGDDDDVEMDMEYNLAESTVCTRDIRQCSDGSIVSRIAENACNFAPCPDEIAAASATRLFFPVWGSDGSIGCMDDSIPPSWASGVYLKESKDDCCNSFFSLQVDECLQA